MSIHAIDEKTKLLVLKYLLNKNESFEDACSKAGLSVKTGLIKNDQCLES